MAGVIVNIGADATQFNQVVNGLPEKMAKASKGMASSGGMMSGMRGMLGGLTATAAVVGIKNLISNMDDLADTAVRLNESTDSIQRVAYAANILAGMDIDSVANSFLKLEKAITDPENAKAAQALKNLGLTAEQLTSMTLDQKVLALGEAFTKARQTGTGYNDILALLGKSAGELIPLLQQSAEAAKLMGETSLVSEEDVIRMGKLNDKIDAYILKIKSLATQGIGKGIEAVENAPSTLKMLGGLMVEPFLEMFKTGSLEAGKAKVRGIIDPYTENIQGAESKEDEDIKKEAEKRKREREERAKNASESAKAAKDDAIKKQAQTNAEKAAEIKRGLAIRRNEFEEKRKGDIASRLRELADQGESKMKDLIGAAFSPLKGDADRSTGRGANVNPPTRGASAQLQQMAAQVALMRKQASTLDKSATHLENIDAQIKKMNMRPFYN